MKIYRLRYNIIPSANNNFMICATNDFVSFIIPIAMQLKNFNANER